ncbi:hypothetical protein CNMCM5793_002373 [Aspergillus hiratsukae]|uniref:Uncharacterized protein n=1 Tax=Aspergillus hiratsukae TaxID=1194566 RepID=A0A8H6PCM7_9EURO|nr:hypothetical protein CNMCM5793_002373 [Aspergillus hiratsukae]
MLEEPVMPPPSGAVSNFARPQDALHTVNLATQVLCMIVTTIIVLLRIFISAHLRKRLGLEDYMTIAGWVGLSRAFPLFIDDGNRIHEKLELFKVPSGSSRKKLDGLSLLIRAVFKPFNRIAGNTNTKRGNIQKPSTIPLKTTDSSTTQDDMWVYFYNPEPDEEDPPTLDEIQILREFVES